MARHDTYVERTDSSAGVASGLLVAILAVLLIATLALFTLFGGPGRFIPGPIPPTTNVNAPAQGQPQPQPPQQININR
jgi:hypothetical protein